MTGAARTRTIRPSIRCGADNGPQPSGDPYIGLDENKVVEVPGPVHRGAMLIIAPTPSLVWTIFRKARATPASGSLIGK